MSENVVELRPGIDLDDEGRTLHVVHREEGRFCVEHRRYELHSETRRVYCKDCGKEIPAFEALKWLARDVERYVLTRREFERRAKVARGNLEETERLERNAKARARKALSKIEVCECRSSWGGWGSAYWRFCPMCGGSRPLEVANRDELARAAVSEFVREAGCADLLDAVTKRLAVALADADTDEAVEQAQTFLVTRVADALVPVVHGRRRVA